MRCPRARPTEYNDKRADPWGRLPYDTWSEFPRVCGTFREREGWHGCQMPEALLMLIILVSSNPGDVVLDPFAGSGTTGEAAHLLGRRFLLIDSSEDAMKVMAKRFADIDDVEFVGPETPKKAAHS